MMKTIKGSTRTIRVLFLFILVSVITAQSYAETTVTINSFNSALFPFLYANVSVDSDGNPVSDLSAENFTVLENNAVQMDFFDITPPDTGGGVRSADIVFLIDVSGSMGAEIADVRRNVNNFAAALSESNIDFRLGLVRFGNSSGANPFTFNSGSLTDDVAVFQGFVATLFASGGYEPGFLAIRQAIAGFTFRPGAQKIFLIITDEDSDTPINKQETIDMLLANSITVHAAVSCSSGNSNGDYCDNTSIRAATGGLLFGVRDSYNSVLDTIVASAGNTYVVRYKSSNPIFNGIERDVEIRASVDGDIGFDTTSYIPGAAPQINLTPETENLFDTGNAALEGASLIISAEVVDTIEPFIADVILNYRTTQIPGSFPTSYSRAAMVNVSGNRWEYTIPGADIQNPGLDFYITSSDGMLSSSSPKVDPASKPHQVAVLPNQAPGIEHETLPKLHGSIGVDVGIEATITDETYSVLSSSLYYRKKGTLLYQKVENTEAASVVLFSENIPGTFISMDCEIEYYLEAQDDLGVISRLGTADKPFSFLPADGDIDDDGLTNLEEDQDADGHIAGDTNNNRTWDAGEVWTETDPYKNDTDGDSLPDGWEVKGYFSTKSLFYHNPTSDAPDVNLPEFCVDASAPANPSGCTNPLKKDVFVEIDWMEDSTHTFLRPREDALEDVVQAFGNSPVNNPDGSAGINLHLDYGQGGTNTQGGDHVAYSDNFDMGDSQANLNDWSNFNSQIKDVHFADLNRRRIFHYCVFMNHYNGTESSGLAWIEGSDFIVSLGSWNGGNRQEQAGTFMHEFGHNLGLRHGGHEPTNYKPNYLSVMNYAFQFSGLWQNGNDGIMDYSRTVINLDENCLDETVGINGGTPINGYGTKFYTDPGIADGWQGSNEHFASNANGPINWNRDLDSTDRCVDDRSVNDAPPNDPDNDINALQGYDDWANLVYRGAGNIGAGQIVAVETAPLHQEIDIDTARTMLPYPPSGLAARALPNVVRLGWKPSNLEIVNLYRIYRKTSGSDYQLIGNTQYSIYNDTDITPGAVYIYTVTTVDIHDNESPVMDEIQVAVPTSLPTRR